MEAVRIMSMFKMPNDIEQRIVRAMNFFGGSTRAGQI